jgi:hypothetical protein
MIDDREKTTQSKIIWRPADCANCHAVFDEKSWKSYESVFTCPQCKIAHAATIQALTELIHGEFVDDYLYPKNGDLRFTQPVQKSTLDKVDSIRDRALSLGWNEARLYQNRGQFRFPYGENDGLVCFIFELVETVHENVIVRKRSIGEVTRQHIEIVCDNFGIREHIDDATLQVYYALHPFPVRDSLHFYNQDVDQPWLKRNKV